MVGRLVPGYTATVSTAPALLDIAAINEDKVEWLQLRRKVLPTICDSRHSLISAKNTQSGQDDTPPSAPKAHSLGHLQGIPYELGHVDRILQCTVSNHLPIMSFEAIRCP